MFLIKFKLKIKLFPINSSLTYPLILYFYMNVLFLLKLKYSNEIIIMTGNVT